MGNIVENIPVSNKLFHTITSDSVKTAEAVGLVYVTSDKPGYKRVRNGSEFYYLDGNRKLQNKTELERIKRLVLPPAWENVWICKLPDGHLQATGFDKMNRKQYKYHPLWVAIRNETKFFRLKEFGEKNIMYTRSSLICIREGNSMIILIN